MSAPQLRTRPPTGAVPWPLVLVEGEEKSGKTWAGILLSASPRVGQAYVLDLGEGSADEYGAIPGARFEVIIHDGTWLDYYGQVRALHELAGKAAAAGEPPVVLVVDTASDEWEGLKDWTSGRALDRFRRRATKAGRSVQDPAPEDLRITSDLWNDAGDRHRRLMTLLLTFPGIVVMTARGKEVAKIGDNGQPIEGQKDYRVEGHKSLAYDASLWVRMSRTAPPLIVGCRSVRHGIRPGHDKPKTCPADVDNLVEWLVFDVLGCDPRTAKPRDIKRTTGGDLTPEEAGIPPEVDLRNRIGALIAARKWNGPELVERFRERFGVTTAEASTDQLGEFLAELQQDAAVELAEAEAAQ